MCVIFDVSVFKLQLECVSKRIEEVYIYIEREIIIYKTAVADQKIGGSLVPALHHERPCQNIGSSWRLVNAPVPKLVKSLNESFRWLETNVSKKQNKRRPTVATSTHVIHTAPATGHSDCAERPNPKPYKTRTDQTPSPENTNTVKHPNTNQQK